MAKAAIKPNAKTAEILVDLDKYRDFCRGFGYRFNEADLYNNKSYPFQQYNKFLAGKRAKDMWLEDGKRFGLTVEAV